MSNAPIARRSAAKTKSAPGKANRADTLESIRAESFQLFGRYGYDGVSIGDIAKVTGLSKGALYWHYTGKDALYVDCLRALHAIFDEYVLAPMQVPEDPVARLLAFFHGISELVRDERVEHGIAGYWLQSARTDLEQVQAVQLEFEQRTASVMQESLERGMQTGLFDLQDDLGDMSRAMIALMESIVLPLRGQSQEEVQATLGVLARSFVRAYTQQPQLVEMFRTV